MTLLVLCLTASFLTADTLQDSVRQAVMMLTAKQTSEHPIPLTLLRQSKAIGFVSLTKGAFGIGGARGEGIIVVKTTKGWSAPIAFTQSGGSFGLQFGVDLKRYIYVFNSDEAWQFFTNGGSIRLQAALAATAGSSNVNAAALNGLPITNQYVYSLSDGALVSAAVGGQVVGNDEETNHAAYGTSDAYQILNPKVLPPKYSRALYDLLNLVAR